VAQVNWYKKEVTETLLSGHLKPAMFASALICMARERQNAVISKLVVDAGLRGHLRCTYIAHLEALASVLSPSGMSLAAHVYKVSQSEALSSLDLGSCCGSAFGSDKGRGCNTVTSSTMPAAKIRVRELRSPFGQKSYHKMVSPYSVLYLCLVGTISVKISQRVHGIALNSGHEVLECSPAFQKRFFHCLGMLDTKICV
jgi:hypothetical protein